jgi:hypothetical protein
MLHLQSFTSLKPHLSNSISCKYILENTDHYLLEVKKIDEGDLYETFYWLKISKDHLQITELNLKSIDSSRDVEERFFDEGYLKFNADKGILIEKFNLGQHHYQLLNCTDAQNMFVTTLQKFFSEDKRLMN